MTLRRLSTLANRLLGTMAPGPFVLSLARLKPAVLFPCLVAETLWKEFSCCPSIWNAYLVEDTTSRVAGGADYI